MSIIDESDLKINRSIPFIIYDNDKKLFELTEESIKLLKGITTKFSIISIAGMYRTGKSYLLNKMLLNKPTESKGFIVGKTVNACTSGLWIYNKPLMGLTEEGENVPVFLIDTEGLGSLVKDVNHDVKIFTLAVLLCSIDESSIESLSYVVNLSKLIQVNSKEENEKFFPFFLWILRDFTLQLSPEANQEKDGNSIDNLNNYNYPITSRDYLENALSTKKNSTIKESIKNFFPERDCMTMVRPTIKEYDLQNLDSLPDEKLRTEFIEQIITLRKSTLNKCKVKTFKGMNINGDQYITIIQSYVEMINSGVVPTIDSIWSTMCKCENNKSIEIAEKEYDRILKDHIINNNFKFFDEEELIHIHKEAKENSIKLFIFNSMGEDKIIDSFFIDLKIKIKEKRNNYYKINEEEMRNSIHKYLKNKFEVIELKLKCDEIKSLIEIENHMANIENDFNNTFLESNLSNEMLLDFKVKLLLLSGNFFCKNLHNQLDVVIDEKIQMAEKYNIDLIEQRDKLGREKMRRELTMSGLSIENFALKNELNGLMEKYKDEIIEKDQRIKSLTENLDNLKTEFCREKEDLNSKLNNISDVKKQSDKKSIQVQAEYEKEKALLDSKLDNLIKQIEEMNRKEKSSGHDLKTQLKEQQIALKESTNKNDKIIRDLKSELEKLNEKLIDLESVLFNKESQIELERMHNEENLIRSKSERENLNEKLINFKKKSEDEKTKLQIDIDKWEKEHKTIQILIRSKEEEISDKLKQVEDDYNKKLDRLEREVLISNQSKEFLELKCTELNNQLIDQKNNHDKIIKALEGKINMSTEQSTEFRTRVEEIKEYYEGVRRQLEAKYNRDKDVMQRESDSQKEIINLKNISIQENERSLLEIKEKLNNFQNKNTELKSETNRLEDLINLNQSEFLKKIKEQIEENEKGAEVKEKKYNNEIYNIKASSEESLGQLKSIYEIERLRLEEKIKDEKIKQDVKLKSVEDDYELKIEKFSTEKKEEIDDLHNDYNELDGEYQNFLYNAEHEISLLNQKIESLETSIKEHKENILNTQAQCNQTIVSKTEAFNAERRELASKIEELRNESNNKEKEIASCNLKREILEKSSFETEQSLIMQRRELEEDIKELITKHDLYKYKQQEIIDELLIKKLEFTRETALLKQQIEFLNTRLEDQTTINEENQLEYEENIHSLKSDLTRDLNNKLEAVHREKDELNDKLNKKKKEIRDLEQTFLKQTCIGDNEKNSLNDKINILTNSKQELIDNYQSEIEKLSKDMSNMRNEYFKEVEGYIINIEELKKKIKEFNLSFEEKEKKNEIERALSENKVKKLEKENTDHIQELANNQYKAEKTIDALQKKSIGEKNQLDTHNKEKLIDLERRYQSHIRDLNDEHESIYSEMVSQNQELERELQNLSIQAERQNKSFTDPIAINKKVGDLIEVQDRLKKELEVSKKEKDKKMTEYQAFVEREKELFKYKISDTEQKYKEIESKRAGMIVEHEKERANWNMEKDHLNYNIAELEETTDRLQKKTESLIRENEKMKEGKDKNKDGIRKYNNSAVYGGNVITGSSSSGGFNSPNKTQLNQTPKVSNGNNSKLMINDFMSTEDKFDVLFNSKFPKMAYSKILKK